MASCVLSDSRDWVRFVPLPVRVVECVFCPVRVFWCLGLALAGSWRAELVLGKRGRGRGAKRDGVMGLGVLGGGMGGAEGKRGEEGAHGGSVKSGACVQIVLVACAWGLTIHGWADGLAIY